MQQRGGEFHLHAFAKRELTDWLAEQLANFEHVDQFVECALKSVGLDAVDFLMESERLLGG